MNTILNVSEFQFEAGLLPHIEAGLRTLLHQAVHGEIESVAKTSCFKWNMGTVKGSMSYKMWLQFEATQLSTKTVVFKKITLISLENRWEYKSTYREFERWRTFKSW